MLKMIFKIYIHYTVILYYKHKNHLLQKNDSKLNKSYKYKYPLFLFIILDVVPCSIVENFKYNSESTKYDMSAKFHAKLTPLLTVYETIMFFI